MKDTTGATDEEVRQALESIESDSIIGKMWSEIRSA